VVRDRTDCDLLGVGVECEERRLEELLRSRAVAGDADAAGVAIRTRTRNRGRTQDQN